MMKLRWILRSLTPGYWLQLNKFSPAWDRHLNALLDSGATFEYITNGVKATLGGVEMWVANHPYASFTIAVPGCKEVRPRRATIARAHAALMQQRPDCEVLIAIYLSKMVRTPVTTTSLTPEQLEANRKEQAEYTQKRGFEKPGEPRL